MNTTHPPGMDCVTQMEFSDALSRLQAMLGQEVRALVNFHGTFGACQIEGTLTRVQTLPPDDQAVNLLIDERQGILLDPIDTEVLLVGASGEEAALEFHLPSGVAIRIETIPSAP